MERILAYFGSYKFIFSVCIVAAALVCWLLLRHLIHRFTEKITAASALSGRRQTYLALALNSVRGLLALLALGIRGIRLGPTLPAFLSPGVAAALQQKYDLKPITTPEADLAACLGSHAAD